MSLFTTTPFPEPQVVFYERESRAESPLHVDTTVNATDVLGITLILTDLVTALLVSFIF